MNRFLVYFQKILGTYQLKGYSDEILMAQKFNSTIMGSEWFRYKSISPGGSAVDYAFFYTLYRTLCSKKPKKVLEFGLGQSSKMVHQYADYYHANAITVEHDPQWVDFFNREREGDYDIDVKIFELEEIQYGGGKSLTYRNCFETFKNDKFDLIIVDGPFGMNMKYSRTQIIDLAKHCIENDFVIIIDDYQRKGEQNTVKEIFTYFNQTGVEYVFREYKSLKSHILITNPENRFLLTLG